MLGKEKLIWHETPITILNLKQKLQKQYPELSSIEQTMTAVNEEYAADDTSVQDGDVVAFIPPVSGG